MNTKGILKEGIKLNPNMGELVLARLGQLVDLEKPATILTGPACYDVVIAGQAVASAVAELFGDGSAVAYNDVDAFALASPSYVDVMVNAFCESRSTGVVLASIRQTDANLEIDTYGNLTTTAAAVYRFSRSTREGLLNIIYGGYYTLAGDFRRDDVHRFLASFDMNCVQVGVRLSDKTLVWTSAFERFLATRELLVQNVATPLHTAMRWAKKKQELAGVFGNDDAAMDLLCAAAVKQEGLNRDFVRSRPDPGLTFSTKFAEMFKQHEGALSPYFRLANVPSKSLPLFTLDRLATPTIAQPILEALPRAALPTYARASRMFYGKYMSRKLLDVFEKLVPRSGESAKFSLKAVYPAAVVCRDGMQHVVRDRSAKDLAFISKLTEEHDGLGSLAFAGLSYAQMLVLCKTLAEMSKTRGLYVFGLIDTYVNEAHAALRDLSPEAIPEGVRVFISKLEKQLEEMKAEATYLFPRGVFPVKIAGYRVTELRDPLELQNEGQRMRHCVGGYALAVLRGHTAIFSLVSVDNPKDRATLEVGLREVGGFSWGYARTFLKKNFAEVQLRAVQNQDPTPEAKKAAGMLIQACRLRQSCKGFDRLPMGLLVWVTQHLPQALLDALTVRMTVSLPALFRATRLRSKKLAWRIRGMFHFSRSIVFPTGPLALFFFGNSSPLTQAHKL